MTACIGVAADSEVVFGIVLGSGIGGGLIVNRRIIVGRSGFSGEWGHGNQIEGDLERFRLTRRECGCGSGVCLDLFGAGLGLANIYEDYSGIGSNAQDIVERWERGEATATAAIDTYIRLVSRQLTVVANVLDPHLMPVGGGLSNAPRLIAALDTAVRAKSLGSHPEPLIVPGKYNRSGCLLGASLLGRAL